MRRLVALGALLLAAGCTSGPGGGGSSPAATSSPPATSTRPSSSAAMSSSSAPARTTSESALAACTVSAVRIGAVRGVGASQQQFATLTFRNVSNRACLLAGYAGAQLLHAGRAIGPPAATAGAPVPAVRFAAGHSATVRLSGPSSCNAPVADAVRVTLPEASGHVDRVLLMRACPITVSVFAVR